MFAGNTYPIDDDYEWEVSLTEGGSDTTEITAATVSHYIRVDTEKDHGNSIDFAGKTLNKVYVVGIDYSYSVNSKITLDDGGTYTVGGAAETPFCYFQNSVGMNINSFTLNGTTSWNAVVGSISNGSTKGMIPSPTQTASTINAATVNIALSGGPTFPSSLHIGSVTLNKTGSGPNYQYNGMLTLTKGDTFNIY